MSILKELHPKVRRAMDADKELYQHSHAALVRDMQKATLIIDLPVGTANTLLSYAETADFDFESQNFILKLYQIFGR